MKKIEIALLITLFVFSGLFLVSKSVDACSPSIDWPPTPQENYDNKVVVFVGTVSSIELVGGDFGSFKITFDIEKSYKGDISGSVIVSTAASSAACGYDSAEEFPIGSTWAMYTNESFSTSHLAGNKMYDSLELALKDIDALANIDRPIGLCTLEYDPVCGQKDNGVRCITEPCDSYDEVTYSNECHMLADEAEFVHEGECVYDDSDYDREIPPNCSVWFDGCNNCGVDPDSGEISGCTELSCETYEPPRCTRFDDSVNPPVENPDDTVTNTNTDTNTDTDNGDQDTTDTSDDDPKAEKRGIIRKVADAIVSVLDSIFNLIF